MIVSPILKLFCAVAGLVMLGACSSLPISDPVSPTVTVDRIRLGKLSLRKQEVDIRLNVENSNDFDLPLQMLAFTVNVEGDELATGSSEQSVTVPANGAALLNVSVSSSRLFRFIFEYIQAVTHGKTQTDYNVKGFVKLANWPRRIPFDVDGVLDAPDELVESSKQ